MTQQLLTRPETSRTGPPVIDIDCDIRHVLTPGVDLDPVRQQHLGSVDDESGIRHGLGSAGARPNGEYGTTLAGATDDGQVAEWHLCESCRVTTRPIEEPHRPEGLITRGLITRFDHLGGVDRIMCSTGHPHGDFDHPAQSSRSPWAVTSVPGSTPRTSVISIDSRRDSDRQS